MVVDDGSNRETLAKTIPINLGKVEVTFYPEGGDLVGRLEQRRGILQGSALAGDAGQAEERHRLGRSVAQSPRQHPIIKPR